MSPASSPKLIFSGRDFLVVEKPALCLTVPSRHEEKDSRPVLGRLLEESQSRRLWPVHRLDYEVSGLVLFALHGNAQKIANRWFEKRQVKKRYLGVSGPRGFEHWPESLRAAREEMELREGAEFHWTCRLLRGKRRSYESPQGDLAETWARVDQLSVDRLSWSLFPVTGRPHQLRFEMSRHGFPLLGDELYGAPKDSWSLPGLALRAVELDFSQIPNEQRGELPPRIEIGAW